MYSIELFFRPSVVKKPKDGGFECIIRVWAQNKQQGERCARTTVYLLVPGAAFVVVEKGLLLGSSRSLVTKSKTSGSCNIVSTRPSMSL